MKRLWITLAIIFFTFNSHAQFNNSWIDYSKTYYKFKLAKDTLTRIYQPVLAAAGLASVPAENFQLWRNGKQVRLFTSVPTGILGSSDYLEFWGEMNDGKPDKALYRDNDYQLSEKYSLETDTATYFLTVNNTGANLRYVTTGNPVAGNSLPAEPYFMRRIEINYHDQINKGFAVPFNEYIYSSSYDMGEGWTSANINPCAGCNLVQNLQNLNKYTAGPANSVMFTIAAAGSAPNQRNIFANLFNTQVLLKPMNNFNYLKDTVRNLPLSVLSSPSDLQVSINGTGADVNDRVVVSSFSVTYPATFNFNNEKNFYFELKDNSAGNYLVITNFNTNGMAPILYDYTSGKRIIGDIAVAGQVRFVLAPSTDPIRRFNLMSGDVAGNSMPVTSLTQKNFVNYANASNQGNYLIISNSVLYNNGSGVNNVDLYRQYRSSITGGGFNAKVYNVDELNDQFGFGIKKHPSALRDFILYANQQFSTTPKYAFIIGRGLSYLDYMLNQTNSVAEQLDLVQTFGWPASDVLLAASPGSTTPVMPIGRLGAINGTEVGTYLDKIKQYEQLQQAPGQTLADKGWMKNVLHTVGASNSIEEAEFMGYMNHYKSIIEDTLFGGRVETYSKTSVASIEQQQSQRISQLFQEGLGYVKYFGHSSANELAINLNYPENYQNAGKYPFMHVSGCTVGNFFAFNVDRPVNYSGMSLSEKYILLNQKGSIGFLGSTYLGIGDQLDIYNQKFYEKIAATMYGNTIGNQLKSTLQDLGPLAGNPILRMHMEEINLHGDPALKLNSFAKPDYVIEDQLVKFTPNIITVADNPFTIDVKIRNIGRAVRDSMWINIKQTLPDNSVKLLYNQYVAATLFMDSIHLIVHINPTTDKGLNRLTVSIDPTGRIDELSELNNVFTKDFYIFEDELRPISPYNYAIINQQGITYYASTANPLSGNRQYVMEVDTTALFNSPFKKTFNAAGPGGVIEFKPTNIVYTDSTVYYWRTTTVPTAGNNFIWNTSSFIYLPNSTSGFNQSHYFQYGKNTYDKMNLGTDRIFRFDNRSVEFGVRTGIYPYITQTPEVSLRKEGLIEQAGFYGPGLGPNYEVLRFYIIDTVTNNVWVNTDNGVSGLYGSVRPVPINTTVKVGFFHFKVGTVAERQNVVNFLDNIVPVGHYVVMTNSPASPSVSYPTTWAADDPLNSLYHKLKNAGFTKIDSLYRHIPYVFVYKKGQPGAVLQEVAQNVSDKPDFTFNTTGSHRSGEMTSDKFGPALQWSALHWRGTVLETPTHDSVAVQVYGVDYNDNETLLATVMPSLDTSLSWINAQTYPFIKLKMLNTDSVNSTPNQLRYWRVNGTYLPEGAVAPNILFAMKDTATQGEMVDFKLAFKNISSAKFADSIKINFAITNGSNATTPVVLPKAKDLVSGDTLVVNYKLDTRNYPGLNTISVDVNPANSQPEQYHFNNVLYKNLFVKADDFNPLLDVTFDGVHILNRDIVAAKPHVLIGLKDENRFLALNDTAYISLQVRYPDGSIHNYHFGGDTMRFTPANLSSGNNTATIDFLPYFTQEGEYELIVSGRDVVGNTAGRLDYKINFTVITKAMISNLLNYPNPFTSSTAFVFTLTGSEVPQNIRIQILTVTGKIVREITKDELGPIHVGRNITDYKWDGTDMYGAKLANGVYLYRVLTNLNGKSLDKYKAEGDDTDKYFNKGYGKMVLIR